MIELYQHSIVLITSTDVSPTLQKQVGCFNHRVVTLVADKLERPWSPEVFFGMEV